jgi:hypothetical protein
MREGPKYHGDRSHHLRGTTARNRALRRGANATARGSAATTSRRIARRVFLLIALAFINGPALARADDVPAAPTGLELGLGPRYTQGFGSVGAGTPRVQDLGGPGFGPEPSVGWRIDPHWLVGVYGEFARFWGGNAPSSDHAISAAAGLHGQFHMLPDRRFDPWVGLGFGWRGYWAGLGNGTYGLQGLDLVRLRAGLDYRVSSRFAVGPFVGVTLTDFLWREPVGASRYATIDDKKIAAFVFAGMALRHSL